MYERVAFTSKINELLLRERLSHDYLQNEKIAILKLKETICDLFYFFFLPTNGEIYGTHFKTMSSLDNFSVNFLCTMSDILRLISSVCV